MSGNCGLRNVQILDADLEGSQEFQVLAGDFQLRTLGLRNACSLVSRIRRLLIESDGRLQYEKDVVSGVLHVLNGVIDSLGLRQRIVYGRAEFLDQVFQVVIELQLAPFFRRQGVVSSYAYRWNLVNSQIALFE